MTTDGLLYDPLQPPFTTTPPRRQPRTGFCGTFWRRRFRHQSCCCCNNQVPTSESFSDELSESLSHFNDFNQIIQNHRRKSCSYFKPSRLLSLSVGISCFDFGFGFGSNEFGLLRKWILH
ncbi:hypothetical protein ACFX2K_023206 [Malus domestica]